MSLLDAPMAMLDRILDRRSPPVRPDDPVARLVARSSGRLRPNPAYRRRLRGRVMNQYVAIREGLLLPAPRQRMTSIGRAVLYSSFALAVSVTTVGAASTSSLPGDPLYPVKRQIEQVRIDIAPDWVQPTLLAMALDNRLSEVEALAQAGRWALVPGAVGEVARAEGALSGAQGAIAPSELERLSRHASVLAALIESAPTSARAGLERAMAASRGASTSHAGGGGANGNASGNAGSPGSSGTSGGASGAKPSPAPVGAPSKAPKPTAPPKPTPSAAPAPTAQEPTPAPSLPTQAGHGPASQGKSG